MRKLIVEIKARSSNQDKIREILREKGADFKGVDHQIDTYFRVSTGKLKLREGNIENVLAFYEREKRKGPKQSDVVLYEAPPHSSLKEVLSKALGVLTVVNKQREIYFIGNVKFHLDTVKGLGTFVEIEAVDQNGRFGKDELLRQCKQYMRLFGIHEEDMIEGSYSDLLLARTGRA